MSVVVAVYNTGRYIEPCLDSLVAQSLPASEYEVILVDDGSDDTVTARRLDEFAAAHANVTALHIPNSGWPGKPRNVGIDAAKGEYVYFLDHDDSLAPEALERMYDIAARNHADVVIGKIAGHGRRVPTTLFRRNYESCTVETAPLMESMTPHKGFRRAFLDEHGIRFPEGRRRLEDHVFVVEAYLRAQVVSVLSDYTCYHHIARDDAGNAGFRPIEPVGYYANLREAIDIAERLTEPGPRRDLVMRRWYGVEMLRRVSGKVFAGMSPKHRREMYDEIRRLALERFTTPSVWEPLPASARVVSALLRDGRFDDLVRVAELTSAQALHCEVVAWEWEGGRLRFEALLGLADTKGESTLASVDGAVVYAGQLSGLPREAQLARQSPSAVLELRLRGTDKRHRIPLKAAREADGARVRTRATGVVDPMATGQAPLATGVWDLFLRFRDPDAGADLTRRVGGETGRVSAAPVPPALVGPAPVPVVPYVTEKDNLSLDVGARTKDLVSGMRALAPQEGVVASVAGTEVSVELPLHVSQALSHGRFRLVSALPDGVEVSVPASARPGVRPDRTVVEASLPGYAAGGGLAVSWQQGPGDLQVRSAPQQPATAGTAPS